jgi:hypothetical protein
MSDGFPSDSCAGAILSRGGVVEAGDRFPASVPVSCRGHKMGEVLIRMILEPKVLWIGTRVGQSTVVRGPDGGRSG